MSMLIPHKKPQHRAALSAVTMGVLLQLANLAQAEPAATVLFASGDVRIRSAQGVVRSPAKGAVVDSGDTVETGRGRLQLRMVDGAMMSLNEETVLRLDEYHLASAAGDDEKGFMSLVKGGLRTISGSIGKARQERYKLDTPAGTIGIRGTEYAAALDQGLRVSVFGGRVAVCNDGGCVDVPKGFGAVTPSKSVRPAVSTKVAVVVTPAETTTTATAADASDNQASKATAASTGAGATLVSTLPNVPVTTTEGERVARYVAAVLSSPEPVVTPPAPAPGEDVLPGMGDAGTPAPSNAPVSITRPPVAPAPAPAPATSSPPAPAPSSGSSPAPSPAPAPAPGPTPMPAPTPPATPGALPGTPPAPTPPATSPSPLPSPAPAPAPTSPSPDAPAPLPGPGPAPALQPAGPRVPLPNGVGTVALVWTTDKGDNGSGLTTGNRTFAPNSGLTDLDEAAKDKKILDKGVPVDASADGTVAWGRWTGGESKVKGANGDGKGKVSTLHYVAFVGQPSLPAIGSFSAFAATAPTVTSDGKLVATGAINTAGGRVNVALTRLLGGTATYLLSVPVAGQTFSLSGVATQVGSFGFAGTSLITSPGNGCNGGCTGTLGDGISVRGLLGGNGNNRLGVTYGFDSRLGNVTGVIVFKP